MRFAVTVNGKKFPVTVLKEPSNTLALSGFLNEGNTYRGNSSQFNNLKFDKVKQRYTASSILVIKNTIVKEQPIVTIAEVTEPEPEPAPEELETLIEEPEIEPEEQLLESTSESQDRKQAFLEELALEAQKATKLQAKELQNVSIKKVNFRPRWAYLFPEAETYGEGIFEKHKHVWIKMHGSEHLNMANNMHCKCDSLYITERALMDFPKWELHDNLVYYEIDSPDFGILTFLKNFTNLYRDLFTAYRSTIHIATTDLETDEDKATIVISDYLGHADLSISFVDLVGLYGDRC